MHRFVLRAKQDVECPDPLPRFPRGTEIDCYQGFKYPPDTMRRQFVEAGLTEIAYWQAESTGLGQYLLMKSNNPASCLEA
ncbi:hypothetical protein MRB53_042335 [Persea americana]|nr:hypothetical protein MRB53_042335 [Persea americana]